MNPSDSKNLEEAEEMVRALYLELPGPVANDVAIKVKWLVFKITEQDREIERLRGSVNKLIDDGEKNDERWTAHAVQLQARAEKAEAKIEALNRAASHWKEDCIKAEAEIKRLNDQVSVIKAKDVLGTGPLPEKITATVIDGIEEKP